MHCRPEASGLLPDNIKKRPVYQSQAVLFVRETHFSHAALRQPGFPEADRTIQRFGNLIAEENAGMDIPGAVFPAQKVNALKQGGSAVTLVLVPPVNQQLPQGVLLPSFIIPPA